MEKRIQIRCTDVIITTYNGAVATSQDHHDRLTGLHKGLTFDVTHELTMITQDEVPWCMLYADGMKPGLKTMDKTLSWS